MMVKPPKINPEDDNPSNDKVFYIREQLKTCAKSKWCGVRVRKKLEEQDDEGRETNSNGGTAFTPPTPSG
jgi:hypothetical protein